MNRMEQEPGEMHWSDNWMFKRLVNGDVRIRKAVDVSSIDGVIVEAIIPAAEWVSLIHHLGAQQTAEAFQAATVFHVGE